MRQVVFTVYGTPVPQGSKKGFYNKKANRVVIVDDNKKTKPWRQDVKEAALAHVGGDPFVGPLEIKLRFMLPRPKGHYGTGRNQGTVRPSAPPFPDVRPDVDKLARAMLDGLTDGGVFKDDSQVVSLRLEKRYTSVAPHCDVVVREAVE